MGRDRWELLTGADEGVAAVRTGFVVSEEVVNRVGRLATDD